jgi:hypothetical protein
MKQTCRRLYPLCMSVLLALSSTSMGQGNKRPAEVGRGVQKISAEQQEALEMLRDLAWNLKREFDKLAAANLQARIADLLWKFDEPFARDVFRWSFDAARQPAPEDFSKANRSAYVARQAATIKDILSRLSVHDDKRAEAWLKTLEEEKASAAHDSQSSRFRSELLIQMALQIATSNPEQAQRLGLLSLSGTEIPEGLGRLLFSLANVNKGLSDELFRATVTTLRRNGYVYDTVLIALSNYLFGPSGDLRSDATPADAQLLATYFVEAAWHQVGGAGVPLPESSAMFYSFLEVRAVPIVARYNPDRLQEMQGQMRQLAGGLTQEQAQRTGTLSLARDQQITISNRNSYDIDEQIERAEKQRDSQVRDSLFTSIAYSLMRQDSERALKVAAMIDDADARKSAEDDINLVRIQKLLSSRAYERSKEDCAQVQQYHSTSQTVSRVGK